MASKARCLALVESWLATTAVTRKTKSATQFWVSAMVKVKSGGRKKKLKHNMPATDATIASSRPHAVATARVASRNVMATVVALASLKTKK